MSTTPLSAPQMSTPQLTKVRGRFLWYDLMTTDPAAAVPFYRDVIGWTTQQWQGPEPYEMWLRGDTLDTMVGGVMRLPDEAAAMGAPPHWLAYIGTDNIQRTTDRAQQLGATVLVPPTPIPDVGQFAVIRDPQGAVFAIYQPSQPKEGGWDPQVGDISWHELLTTDLNAGFDFYSQLVGWQEISSFESPQGPYRMYGQNSDTYGGMYAITEEMQGVPPNWLVYIRVADLDQAVARVRERGGQILMGPMEVPGGDRIAQCMDPQGAAFALHQKK